MDSDIETLIAGRFGKSRTSIINTTRYENDPVFREKVKKKAIEWNQRNPEQRKQIAKKWNAKNAAASQKRYRERKKKEKCLLPQPT